MSKQLLSPLEYHNIRKFPSNFCRYHSTEIALFKVTDDQAFILGLKGFCLWIYAENYNGGQQKLEQDDLCKLSWPVQKSLRVWDDNPTPPTTGQFSPNVKLHCRPNWQFQLLKPCSLVIIFIKFTMGKRKHASSFAEYPNDGMPWYQFALNSRAIQPKSNEVGHKY